MLVALAAVGMPVWAANNNGWDTDLIYGLPTWSGGGHSNGQAVNTSDYVSASPLPAASATVSANYYGSHVPVDDGAGGNATFAGLVKGDIVYFGDPANGVKAEVLGIVPAPYSASYTPFSTTGMISVDDNVDVTDGMTVTVAQGTRNALMTKNVNTPGLNTNGHYGWTPIEKGALAYGSGEHPYTTMCFSGHGNSDARLFKARVSGNITGYGNDFFVSEFDMSAGAPYEIHRIKIGSVLGVSFGFCAEAYVGCLRYNPENNTLALSFSCFLTDDNLTGWLGRGTADDANRQGYVVEFDLPSCSPPAPSSPITDTVVDGAHTNARQIKVDDGAGGDAGFGDADTRKLYDYTKVQFSPSGEVRVIERMVKASDYYYTDRTLIILDRPVTLSDNETMSRYIKEGGWMYCAPQLKEFYEAPKANGWNLPEGPGIDFNENGMMYLTAPDLDTANPGDFGSPDTISIDTSVVGKTGGALASNYSSFPSNGPYPTGPGNMYDRLINGNNVDTVPLVPPFPPLRANYRKTRMIGWRPGTGMELGNLVIAEYYPAAIQAKRPMEFDLDATDVNGDLVMLGTEEGEDGRYLGIGTGGGGDKRKDNRLKMAIRAQRNAFGGVLMASERESKGGSKIYYPDGTIVRYEKFDMPWSFDPVEAGPGFWDLAMPWQTSATVPDYTGACCTPPETCEDKLKSQCAGGEDYFWVEGQTCDLLWTYSEGVVGCDLVCFDPFADADGDGDVDQDDFAVFQLCYTGGATPVPGDPEYCVCLDVAPAGTPDDAIDALDYDAFKNCVSGPNIPANPACD
jgi:hypothetical protein